MKYLCIKSIPNYMTRGNIYDLRETKDRHLYHVKSDYGFDVSLDGNIGFNNYFKPYILNLNNNIHIL